MPAAGAGLAENVAGDGRIGTVIQIENDGAVAALRTARSVSSDVSEEVDEPCFFVACRPEGIVCTLDRAERARAAAGGIDVQRGGAAR